MSLTTPTKSQSMTTQSSLPCHSPGQCCPMMLLEVGSKLIDNGEYEKAMPLLDRSFHIVTSPSSNGMTHNLELPPFIEWGSKNESTKKEGSSASTCNFSTKAVDMYLEDAEDVGPRMFRKAIVVSDTRDMALVQLLICYNKAIIYHATEDLSTASNFYELILSRIKYSTSIPGFCLPPEWLQLAMCVYNNLGQICYTHRVEQMAISHFETALEFGMAMINADGTTVGSHLDFADVLSNWCRCKYMDADFCNEIFVGLEEVLKIRTSFLNWDHVDVASAHFNLGVAEYLRKNNSKSRSHLLYYLKITSHHATNGIDAGLDPLPALVYILLIDHDDKEVKLSRDLVWGLRSLQEKRSEVGPRHYEVAVILNYIGTVLFHANELEHALLFLQEELRVEEHLAKPSERFGLSVTSNNIGRILQELGRYPQAIHHYHHTLSYEFDLEDDYDDDDIMVASCQNLIENDAAMNLYSTVWYNLGLIHDKMGAFKEAIKAFKMALQLRRNMLGSEHADVACLVYNIGVLQMEQQMLQDAAVSFREALQIRSVVSSGQLNDRHVVTTLQKLASMQKARGDIRSAVETCQEIVQVLNGSSDYPRCTTAKLIGAAYREIAELYHALGNLNAALENGEMSLQALRSSDHESNFTDCREVSSLVQETATSLLLLGSLQHELCEPVKAEACFEEAVKRIQQNASKGSTQLLPLLEVSLLLRSGQCAAEA